MAENEALESLAENSAWERTVKDNSDSDSDSNFDEPTDLILAPSPSADDTIS